MAVSKTFAIIIPGVTDLNRGDQALAWEAARLIQDLGIAEETFFLDVGGDAKERKLQTRQTRNQGYELLRRILPHPRHKRYNSRNKVQESWTSLVGMLDLFNRLVVARRIRA